MKDYEKHGLFDKDGKLHAKEKSPDLSQSVTLGVNWKPNYVKGLSLSASRTFDQTKTQKVVFDRAAKKPVSYETRSNEFACLQKLK